MLFVVSLIITELLHDTKKYDSNRIHIHNGNVIREGIIYHIQNDLVKNLV